jgi:hypothetical protein
VRRLRSRTAESGKGAHVPVFCLRSRQARACLGPSWLRLKIISRHGSELFVHEEGQHV